MTHLCVSEHTMEIPAGPLIITAPARKPLSHPHDAPSWATRLWLLAAPILPLFFLAGWLICKDSLGNDLRFAVASLIALLASSALVATLRRPIEGMIPIIVLLVIFVVGYFLKFYWMALAVAADDRASLFRFLLPEVQPYLYTDNLLRTFELSTWGYVAFCAAAIVAVVTGLSPRGRAIIRTPGAKVGKLCFIHTSVALILFLITALLTYGLGLGINGRENIQLPFKLTGLIYFLRSLLVPGLLFLVLVWSDRKGLRLYWWAAMAGIIAFGISEILVEASRGALVSAFAIPLGALWLTYRAFTKNRLLVLVIALVLVSLLRPALTIYRQLRAADSSEGIAQVVATTFYSVQVAAPGASVQTSAYLGPFQEVLFRIIGVDSVLFFAPQPDEAMPLDRIAAFLLRQEDFAGAFTRQFIGWQSGVSFGAPSLVGGLYWLGGTLGMVFGVFGMTLFFQIIWAYLYRSRWWATPFAQVSIAGMTFVAGSEGTFGAILQSLFVMVIMFIAIECISRAVWRKPKRA